MNKIESEIYLNSDFNAKIKLAEFYSYTVNGYSDIYQNIDIENHLLTVFEQDLFEREGREGREGREKNVLHIISEAYITGGHTRLCERLSSMDDNKGDLLVTRKLSVSIFNRLNDFFKNIINVNYSDSVDLINKMFYLIREYEKIVLHIHPDDICSAITIGLIKKYCPNIIILFINHADHLFCYGKQYANLILEVSNRGYEIDVYKNCLNGKLSFLGIPINSNNKKNNHYLHDNNIFIMAGDGYKMKPKYLYSAPKIVCDILSKNKNDKFIIIGVKFFDYWWWLTKIRYKRRVRFYNKLSYDDYIKKINSANICIDTYPLTGGTGFVEMYLNGLYPVGIKIPLGGYSPLDLIKSSSVDELLEFSFKDFNKLDVDIMKVNSYESVKERYLNASKLVITDVPECLKYIDNDLDFFLDKEKKALPVKQVKVFKLFSFMDAFFIFKEYFSINKTMLSLFNTIIVKVKNKF